MVELTLQSPLYSSLLFRSREGTEVGESVVLLLHSLFPLKLCDSPGRWQGLLPPSCLVLLWAQGRWLGFPIPLLNELMGPPAV